MDYDLPVVEWEVPKKQFGILKRMPGLLNGDDFNVLAAYACIVSDMFPESVIVEIGTYCGKSAFLFGLFGKLKVFTVDNHGGMRDGKHDVKQTLEIAREYRRVLGLTSKVNFVVNDSTKVQWPKKNIGLLFIDGDHSFNAVKADYEHYKPFLMSGAFVLFHDYGNDSHPEVKKFVDGVYDLKHIETKGQIWVGRDVGTNA